MKKVFLFSLFAISFNGFGQLPICFDQPAPIWNTALNTLYNPCTQVSVGIGKSDPRGSLDVYGPTYVPRIGINSDPTALGSKLLHMKSTSTNSTQILFQVENATRTLFQISNNGIVRAREIIIDLTTPWPDYVFTPGYKLKTLKEIEVFINKHGHLPDVPSAEEVAEEGISLGEMDRILLEKIEELTLYLIEQQKIIEEQQKRIEALETQR